jgi:hypothetical protein
MIAFEQEVQLINHPAGPNIFEVALISRIVPVPRRCRGLRWVVEF